MRTFNCVEPCSGYGIAGMGIHLAGVKTEYAFDNDCWDEKSQQFMLDAVKNYNANFKHDDGSNVCERKDIREVTGDYVLDKVRQHSGQKSVHLMFGGPPCVEWTKLNTRQTNTGKNLLILEYLRLVREVQPLVAIMEQVPDFLNPKEEWKKEIRDRFFHEIKNMGYQCRVFVADASDYQVPQARKRALVQLVRNDLNMLPVFPLPIYPKVPITKYIDIDGYSSGQFSDQMKSVELNPQVCTVTGSSPQYFYKGPDVWRPTIPELLRCQSVDPDAYKYVGSKSKLRKGIANGVPSLLAYHVVKCVLEKILEPAFRKYPELF